MAKKKLELYSNRDRERIKEKNTKAIDDPRSEFRRDYSRLIHSPAFRRLQGKTQLFPGTEIDFFRNRLTHSLEVSQIAHGIALHLNTNYSEFKDEGFKIDLDLVQFASLAHDLGHPPFGHQGEDALDKLMHDSGGYEGNAQTFRILSKIEKKEFSDQSGKFSYNSKKEDNRLGLNLTYRSLASVLKYDEIIPKARKENCEVLKAYYYFDEDLIQKIKDKITGITNFDDHFKTLECYIMDIADDIAYSTYDLEDSLKANFLTPLDLLGADDHILSEVARKVTNNMKKEGFNETYDIARIKKIIFNFFVDSDEPNADAVAKYLKNVIKNNPNELSVISTTMLSLSFNRFKQLANDGYLRTEFTSQLVSDFIKGVEVIPNKIPALTKVRLKKEVREKVEVIKNFVFVSQIESPRLKVVEVRGQEIVKTIFDFLYEEKGHALLPADYKIIYDKIPVKDKYRKRIICDFIAGMTDRYAIEFYGRLKSENPQTIFKPI